MLRACLIAAAIAATVTLLFAGLVVGLGLYTDSPQEPSIVVYPAPPDYHDHRQSQAAIGNNLYQQKCISCHAVEPDAQPSTGPTFYNLYGSERRFEDGTTAIADADYIRESITDPAAKIVEGYPNVQSPFTGLSERELDCFVAFFKTISENHDESVEPLGWDGQPLD